jgi:hypothetical protein
MLQKPFIRINFKVLLSIIIKNGNKTVNTRIITKLVIVVAQRVVSYDHSKQGYEVILKTKPVSDEKCPTQTIDTVKVKGVDKTVSIETLTYYFESKKRSGGGPIVDIRCSEEDENVVFITFESPEGHEIFFLYVSPLS